MGKTKIIIADNQDLTCNGIISILTCQFGESIEIARVISKFDLVVKLNEIKPQVLIIDFELIDFTDISELIELKRNNPETAILIVSENKSPNTIFKLIDGGIKNYILKTCEADELIEAYKAALLSKKYFCSEIMDIILEQKTSPRHLFEQKNLTSSEIGIVKLITQGLTTKEIANQKNLSFHTIITHRKNIFRKLGVTNTSELHLYAMRAGIIDSTEYYI